MTNLGAGAAGNYDCVITAPSGTLTQGGLWRDVFNKIGGGSVADLTGGIRYPNFPDSGAAITSAEAPSGSSDSSGERWTGWLKPDVTGAYKFFLTSDDASELWLSTTDQPAQKVRIATVSPYNTARKWSTAGKSASINLIAGNRYYIEVRRKENGEPTIAPWPGRNPANPNLRTVRTRLAAPTSNT